METPTPYDVEEVEPLLPSGIAFPEPSTREPPVTVVELYTPTEAALP